MLRDHLAIRPLDMLRSSDLARLCPSHLKLASRTKGCRVQKYKIALASPRSHEAPCHPLADCCLQQTTVYALRCTSGRPSLGTTICGSNGPVGTLTVAPGSYSFSSAIQTRVLGNDVAVTVEEACVSSMVIHVAPAATHETLKANVKPRILTAPPPPQALQRSLVAQRMFSPHP
jgi:hypothetical protein